MPSKLLRRRYKVSPRAGSGSPAEAVTRTEALSDPACCAEVGAAVKRASAMTIVGESTPPSARRKGFLIRVDMISIVAKRRAYGSTMVRRFVGDDNKAVRAER